MPLLLILFISLSFQLYSQTINEIMSSNLSTMKDEDGNFNDWIELYNNTNSISDLTGYALSDDSLNLTKWIMPPTIIDPGKHLLIFASDKNKVPPAHWETVVDWGDFWKYLPGTTEPPAAWKNPEFNDNSWLSGKSGFGYGDNDDATITSSLLSLYVRKSFQIEDTSKIITALLHIDVDDAFVAYLNGVEIARYNIGTPGVPPAYNASAIQAVEPLIIQGQKPMMFLLKNFKSILIQGENILAVQVHNYGTNSSDLTLIPFLTLGMSTAPSAARGKNPILDLPDTYYHTNFKLSSVREKLFLTNLSGSVVDSVTFPELRSDVSFGRTPDGGSSWAYFIQPTPGDTNGAGYEGFAGEPVFSTAGGNYTGTVSVTLTPSLPGNVVRYTLDGSVPTASSSQFINPIQITSTKVLRAREFGTQMLPGKTVTNSYFINFISNLPVFSISSDPANFFDSDNGIYVLGDSAETENPYFGANFWKEWERPIHLEYFDKNGGTFSEDAGVQIFGGWTRAFPQKSLAVFMRSDYGRGTLNYQLFDKLPFDKYESFILRNSGNDWEFTLIRDALITGLADNTGVDKQAYKPVVVFINGSYWGIHELREKINEHFIADHYNLSIDSIDILENNADIKTGSNTEYKALYNFISANNLATASNYDYVLSQVDVDNFINYFLIQIYSVNRDWPGNNLRYWKEKGKGRWRWILYDTDFGFGLYDSQLYTHNTLSFATATNGPNWPNPPWSTLLLRKFLENNSFRTEFINRFADFSNTIFKPEFVNGRIAELKSSIDSEISRHSSRWGRFTYSGWNSNLQVLNTFASRRLEYMKTHFLQKFSLPGMKYVALTINDTSMGRIKLNSLQLNALSWIGSYFMNVPIRITAEPKRGYKFVGWEGTINSIDESLLISLTNDINIKALFAVDESFSPPDIVINEINYNSSASFNPEDWVELYNNGSADVDISGWKFMDSNDSHIFTIPVSTVLNAGSFIVLCRDTSLFKAAFPGAGNYTGNFNFGLDGTGELIRLFDSEMNLIDSLTYDDAAPWPIEPDGNGNTLSLKNPSLDNSIAENWSSSISNGTPGSTNDIFTEADEENGLPAEYSLHQNYPNPFNPSTIIQFQVPVSGKVILQVYDLLGNEIRTLADGEYKAGTHIIEFNASGISSGVYFYKLSAGAYTSVKKMQVIK